MMDLEELIAAIASMSREDLSDRLLRFESDFPMDFTRDYLDRLPVDRLRHVLLAAHLYKTRKLQKASA